MALRMIPPNDGADDERDRHEQDTLKEKLLPQNVEAEQGVLGSIIIDPPSLGKVVTLLEPDDFYAPQHKVIYATMIDLNEAQEPIDPMTLYDALQRSGKLEEAGGISYVTSLDNHASSFRNILSYARIVRRCARNRALIAAAGQIASVAYHNVDDDAACDMALAEVLKVAQRGSTSGQTRTKSLADILDELASDVLQRLDADGPPGIPTGFKELDSSIVGLEPGDLVYLAGRPGSGKSALGLKIAIMAALHCYAREQGSVDVVTLEMSAKQQARRMVAERTEQNTRFIRSGFREQGKEYDQAAWEFFDRERMWLQKRAGNRLFVTDGVVSMGYLRSLVQRAVTERQCRLVVIDQLDLFSDNGDEFERITKMSRQLKQIGKACGVAILCMVQLSRKCEERKNKRPMLSDLRQSGQLEQDADMVWGIYRPAYYDPENSNPQFQQFCELLLLKGRDTGSGTTIPLQFEAEFTRFRDWPFATMPDDPTRDGKGS